MIKFGPSGNSQSFFDEGHEHTLEMPAWLSKRNLDIFEYSFGRGVMVPSETAKKIGQEASKYNIEITAHAPYFINYAGTDPEKMEKSYDHLINSVRVEKLFGGNRVVFHSGSETGQDRDTAFNKVKENVQIVMEKIVNLGYTDVMICPETMGKYAQIGTVEEIIELCKLHPQLYPCVDFGHVNCLLQGALKTTDDYKKYILDPMLNELGFEKVKKMHVHFSKIEFGPKGEKRHLTFDDEKYGPNFEPLAKALFEYKLEPYILSESAGTQAEDAWTMKQIYNSIK